MGNMLQTLRKTRGLTQQGLADLLNCTKSQVTKLENGDRQLTGDWLDRIAPLLNVSRGEILGDSLSPAVHKVTASAKVVSDEPLISIKPATITLPEYLPAPAHLQAFVMGDTSMSDTGLSKGRVFVVRPHWLMNNDYPDGQIYHGHGSIYLLKTREEDGTITMLVRQAHVDQRRDRYAMPRSSDPKYLPSALLPVAKCDSVTGDPEIDHSPCIYGIVEWVDLDCRLRR